MIFYFTGTGNSLQVARDIAKDQGVELVSIAAAMGRKQERYEYELKENEVVGFVFPVYAWNAPRMVLEFIRKLKFRNYNGQYVFSAATCGDNIGNTMERLGAVLKKAGLPLDSGFSLKMPNNYLIGFDVDPKELEIQKLKAAEEFLTDMNRVIGDRKKGVFLVEKGPVPFALTAVVNPLFNRFAIRTERFYATEQCNGCGICAKVCNCGNIRLEASDGGVGRPVWGKECTQCTACIHYCPVRAVQFGKGTEKKGRYTNPNVSLREMIRQE
jgi:NAD-dependent dihydropyrimidine dehydrogenase PreA subunit/flavodoxin